MLTLCFEALVLSLRIARALHIFSVCGDIGKTVNMTNCALCLCIFRVSTHVSRGVIVLSESDVASVEMWVVVRGLHVELLHATHRIYPVSF